MTVGLVGESGCGKTTLGRTLLQLHRPTAGEVRLDGRDIAAMNRRQLREARPRYADCLFRTRMHR